MWSWSALKETSWARICVILIFLDSWCFIFSSGVLIFGAGLELHHNVCAAGIFICIGFYSTSKLLIYLFLAEKVHIVWHGKTHRSSRVYRLCLVTVSLYAVITAFLLVGRIHHIREDGVCIIGLKSYASISLLSYDLYINVFLTGLFLWPICRAHAMNPRIRRVAMRTLIASAVALTTSAVNIAILTVLKGQELGWVCLGSCSLDVTVNAIALFWVSHNSQSESNAREPRFSKEQQGYPAEVTGSTLSLRPMSDYDMLGHFSPVKLRAASDPVHLLGLPSPGSVSPTAADTPLPWAPYKSSGLRRMSSNLEVIVETPREDGSDDHIAGLLRQRSQHRESPRHRASNSDIEETMIMTPWTHLEIPTKVEVQIIEPSEDEQKATNKLGRGLDSVWKGVRRLKAKEEDVGTTSSRSESELGMTSISAKDTLQVSVTRSVTYEYQTRQYGYDMESQRMYPHADIDGT